MMMPGYDAARSAGDTTGERDDQMAAGQGQDSVTTIERAVAGALVLAPASLSVPVLERLRDEDVADPRARFIVSTVRAMLADGIPPDPVTVPSYIESHGLLWPGLSSTHVWSDVHDIASAAPVPASLEWYAARVIECAARRVTAEAGRRVTAFAIGADIAELADTVRAELLAALDALDRVNAKRVAA